MECLSPRALHRDTGKYVVVRCGTCAACKKRYASEWAGRIAQEHRNSTSAYFIGLSYSDFNLPKSSQGFPTLKKSDLQDFFKRIRKVFSRGFYITKELDVHNRDITVKHTFEPCKIRYYAVGEYSPEELRPHYHIILFFKTKITYDDLLTIIFQNWWYAEIVPDIRNLKARHYHYITKYLNKRLTGILKEMYFEASKCTPEFTLLSKRPYIGYVNNDDLYERHIENGIYTASVKYPLHKIYRDKIKDLNPISHEVFKGIRANYIKELQTKSGSFKLPHIKRREAPIIQDMESRRLNYRL